MRVYIYIYIHIKIHLDIWTFGHPGMRASGHLDNKTFGHPSIRTSNIGRGGQRGGPWRRAALNAGFHARGHPTRSEGHRPPVVVSSTSTCGAYDATAVARVDRGVLLGRSARARETRGRVPRRADGAGEVGSEMMAGMNVGGVRAYSTRVSRDARRTSHVLCCISERHPMCPIRGR